MQQRIRDRVHTSWKSASELWEVLHVEHHGKYSVERLYRFKLHSERTSLLWAVVVILLTPFPCILTTILADLIPLEPPERGLAHSQMFWIRATCICWYVSFTIVNQCRHFTVRLPMASAQVLGVNTFVVASSTAIGYGFAKVIGFPLPFFQAMITPGWLVALVISTVFVWGKYIRDDLQMKHELVHYAFVVFAQTCLTFLYPTYISVFRKLSGPPQVACALFLPVMKLLAKNVLNYLLRDLEDAKPELIIFNVEVFHALFVACCMQTSTSHYATAVLIAMDFFFATLSLRKISHAIDALNDLVLGNHDERSLQSSDETQHEREARDKIEAHVASGRMRYVEAAMFLLETHPELLQDSAIRVRPHATRDSIGRIRPTVLLSTRYPSEGRQSQPTQVIEDNTGPVVVENGPHKKAAVKPFGKARGTSAGKAVRAAHVSKFIDGGRRVGNFPKEDEAQKPQQAFEPRSPTPKTSIFAQWRSQSPRIQHVVLPLASQLTEDDKRVVLALSDSCRAQYVQRVLRLLHWTEFHLLVEFVEAIIPIVYRVYLSVAYQLPNKRYYAQLRDIDEPHFQASIRKILVYALLETLSMTVLTLVLRCKLRMSAVHQLTFVLETQWQQVQSKLVLWMAFSIQTPLDHFGMDYSLQFVWLQKRLSAD